MSNLKELTKEQHTNAERQAFVNVLMSGKINPEFYAVYLWNQHKKYDLLEALAMAHGLLADLPVDIRRKQAIEDDFLELWTRPESPAILPSTEAYIMHMKDLLTDPDSIMAHIYVLHMGDLSGGQMIARKAPGAGLCISSKATLLEQKMLLEQRLMMIWPTKQDLYLSQLPNYLKNLWS